MYKIRKANMDDVNEMVQLGRKFWEQTDFYKDGAEYDFDKCHFLTEMLIHNGIVLAAVTDKIVGMLLMTKCDSPFSAGVMVGDVVFYVDEEFRKSGVGADLILSGMAEASKIGATRFNMAFMHGVMPEKAEGLYLKLGLKKSETTYTIKIS